MARSSGGSTADIVIRTEECRIHAVADASGPTIAGRWLAMNPNIGKLEEKYKREFEQILGTKLRVIYRHI
jgi:hypothetical protein